MVRAFVWGLAWVVERVLENTLERRRARRSAGGSAKMEGAGVRTERRARIGCMLITRQFELSMAPFVVYEGSKAQTLVVRRPGELKMSLKLKPELEVLTMPRRPKPL